MQTTLLMPLTIIKEKGLHTYIISNEWGLCEVSYCKEFGTLVGYYSKYDGHYKSVKDRIVAKSFTSFTEGTPTGRVDLDLHISNALNQLENLKNLI